MKHYGDINLNQNELQNAVIKLDTYFPINPKVGQLVFKGKILYICVEIMNDLPVWVPLTKEITSYTHTQNASASVWTVTHNLNTTAVNVQVFDSNNRVIIPDEIEIIDADTVQINVSSAITGKVTVIAGSIEGNTMPEYAYEFTQTSLSSEWTITHNLGRYPVVRVFIGTKEVQPAEIIHDSMNVTRIVFTNQYVGSAKLS